MAKKRILMLNYEFPPVGGGGGVAAQKLAQGFIEQGYDVDYVTTRYADLKKSELVEGINLHRVYVPGRKDLHTATMISLYLFPIFAFFRTLSLCMKHKYELINTHFAVPTGPLGVIISFLSRTPNILSLHGGDIYDPSKKTSPHQKWYFRFVVNRVLNNSTYLVAQSMNTKENTEKYYKVKKEVLVIPLAYIPRSFKKLSRKDLALDSKKKYVISIGRLVPRKDFISGIRAIAKIKDENINYLIIGGGPEDKNLEKEIKRLKVESRVHLVGPVEADKKFQLLNTADVYLLSSLHEGFGIVLQEAMQVGLPIVSTNHGGQVDFVLEDKNGYLVDVGDVDAMANSLKKIFANSDKAKKFGEYNKKQVKEYLPNEIASAYVKVIK